MRKIMAAVSALAVVLCLGVTGPAMGAEVQAEGGFLAGSWEALGPVTLSADTSGFYLAMGWMGTRQTGVEARLWDLEGDSVTANGTLLSGDTRMEAFRTDLVATVTRRDGRITGFGGYSASTRQLTAGAGPSILTVRARGLVAGVELECLASGKADLVITAAVRPGLEVEQKTQSDWLGETAAIQGTGEGYDFAAVFRYAVNPGLTLETGYLNQVLGWRYGEEEPREDTYSQFYAGASLVF